jgi:hypothetical protein
MNTDNLKFSPPPDSSVDERDTRFHRAVTELQNFYGHCRDREASGPASARSDLKRDLALVVDCVEAAVTVLRVYAQEPAPHPNSTFLDRPEAVEGEGNQ